MYINSWYEQKRPEMIWQVITGRVGNRITPSSFEIQGMTSAVSLLLLKIPICSFSQLSSFTSASQDVSSVWFFKKTRGCSALQGRKRKGKKKGKEKETETEEVFCQLWASIQTPLAYGSIRLHSSVLARGDKSPIPLKAPCILAEFLLIKKKRNLHFCSHVILPPV